MTQTTRTDATALLTRLRAQPALTENQRWAVERVLIDYAVPETIRALDVVETEPRVWEGMHRASARDRLGTLAASGDHAAVLLALHATLPAYRADPLVDALNATLTAVNALPSREARAAGRGVVRDIAAVLVAILNRPDPGGSADPVGQTEIAARAGVSQGTVDQWQRRYPDDFPETRWVVAGRGVWDWADVLLWLRRTHRITE